jgi:hypothetical protein
VSGEQYSVVLAYQDLALTVLPENASRAAESLDSAIALIRSSMPGQHPWFALLHAQQSEAYRRAGDLARSQAALDDGSAHVFGAGAVDHPYAGVLAMEAARRALTSNDDADAARHVASALGVRWRALQLERLATRPTPRLTSEALAAAIAAGADLTDADADGIPNAIEVAAGLTPTLADSDHDGVSDADADRDADGVPNRLELGLVGEPFLNWAHYGRSAPGAAGWQTPRDFPMVASPLQAPYEAWTIHAPQGATHYFHLLAAAQARRAMQRGFTLFVRGAAVKGLGSVAVDLSPAGPRFDVGMRPAADGAVVVDLPTKIAPRESTPTAVVTTDWPLLELRFTPADRLASLFADGRLVQRGYGGFRQFQSSREGAVSWAVSGVGDGARDLAAHFQIVWLEIR